MHRPISRGVSSDTLLTNSLGDGSTLSLDFTTGVLDPRLTFTRSTNATFINSSGLVQFADANMMRNSSWSDSNPVPTSWSGAGNTPTIPATGSRTFTVTTAATSYIAEGGASATGSQGLVYTAAVEVTAVSGSPTYNNTILATASPTGVSWYRNGTPANGTDPVQIGVISYVFTSGIGSFVRVGLGASGGSVTNQSITMTKPRLMPGNRVDAPYFPSASATDQYQAPRFDYDPTTLAPRGLLVEGQVPTLNAYSEDYTNAYWTKVGSSVDTTTAVAGPDNVSTTTRRILESATTAQHGIRRGITTTAGTTYTVSVFVKPGSYDSFGFELYWSASYNAKAEVTSISGNTATVTSASGVNATLVRTVLTASGWYRYALTFTHPAAVTGTITPDFNVLVKQTASYAGNGTNYMDMYGFMLETGSGASSYIPTGASTGTRNADKMSLLDITPMQWNQTAGTFALSMDVAAETNTTSFPAAWGMYTAAPVRVIRGLINNSSGTNPRLFVDTWTSAPAQIFSQSIARPASPTLTKFAFALSNSGQEIAMCVNNGAITTGSGTGTMQTPTRLLFHQDPSAGDTEYFPIHIRSFKYWPTNLPNATLQSLTT